MERQAIDSDTDIDVTIFSAQKHLRFFGGLNEEEFLTTQIIVIDRADEQHLGYTLVIVTLILIRLLRLKHDGFVKHGTRIWDGFDPYFLSRVLQDVCRNDMSKSFIR